MFSVFNEDFKNVLNAGTPPPKKKKNSSPYSHNSVIRHPNIIIKKGQFNF